MADQETIYIAKDGEILTYPVLGMTNAVKGKEAKEAGYILFNKDQNVPQVFEAEHLNTLFFLTKEDCIKKTSELIKNHMVDCEKHLKKLSKQA